MRNQTQRYTRPFRVSRLRECDEKSSSHASSHAPCVIDPSIRQTQLQERETKEYDEH